MSEPRPAVAVVLPLALAAYACVALGVAHWWVSGLVAPVVAALLWRRHPRARFAAYVFLSLVALRGALAHRWAALAFAVVVVALMRTTPAAPFEHLRSSMANTDPDAFEGATEAAAEGPGCPFAAMVNEDTAARVPWTPEAEARVERIPEFIRPMARRAIERFAEEHGYASITEAVMDEARSTFGM